MKKYAIIKCLQAGTSVDYSTATVDSLTDSIDRACKLSEWDESCMYVRYAVHNEGFKKRQVLENTMSEECIAEIVSNSVEG